MNHDWAAPPSGAASRDTDHEMMEAEPTALMPVFHGRGHSPPEDFRPQSADTIVADSDMEVEASVRSRALIMVPEDCFIHVLKFLSAEQLCTLARGPTSAPPRPPPPRTSTGVPRS